MDMSRIIGASFMIPVSIHYFHQEYSIAILYILYSLGHFIRFPEKLDIGISILAIMNAYGHSIAIRNDVTWWVFSTVFLGLSMYSYLVVDTFDTDKHKIYMPIWHSYILLLAILNGLIRNIETVVHFSSFIKGLLWGVLIASCLIKGKIFLNEYVYKPVFKFLLKNFRNMIHMAPFKKVDDDVD